MKNKLPSMNIFLNVSKTVNGRYVYGYGYTKEDGETEE